jgi:hypothetical protein
MSRLLQISDASAPNTGIQKKHHLACFQQHRFHPLMRHQSACRHQTGSKILRLQPGIALQDRSPGISRCQHFQDVVDRQAASPDQRFAAENLRVEGTALQNLVFVHGSVPGSQGSANQGAHKPRRSGPPALQAGWRGYPKKLNLTRTYDDGEVITWSYFVQGRSYRFENGEIVEQTEFELVTDF